MLRMGEAHAMPRHSSPRVTGGRLTGRRLTGGVPRGVRPTASRVREALGSILRNELEGARVLDAFAGAGTLTCEAISRGAAQVVAVERSRGAYEAMTRSLSSLGIEGQVDAVRADVLSWLRGGPEARAEPPFDIVFVDPPYNSGLSPKTLDLLASQGWLKSGARVVVESASRDDTVPAPAGLAFGDVRRYGDSRLTVFLWATNEEQIRVTDRREGGMIAIYPGSFDPITLGHLDLVRRGAHLAERLYACVARNINKRAAFSLEERMELIAEAVKPWPNVFVHSFGGLLVEAADEVGANAILRGLRAVSDFDYEFQMAHMNHHLDRHIETVFMMTGEDYFYVSSRLVKEVASLGGDVSSFVSEHVDAALKERFKRGTS